MNHDVEERLRAVLQGRAEQAPLGATMLAAVATTSARRRRQHLTTVAAAVTALAALTAVAVAPRMAPRPPQPVGAPPASTSVLVASTAPTAVTFPFTPATAGGYGTPTVSITAGHPTIRQQLPGPDPQTASMTVHQAQPQPPSSKARSTAATVRGHAASIFDWSYEDPQLAVLAEQRSLVWQESPTVWLELRTEPGAVEVATLLAYAEALRAQPAVAPVPFTFGLTPAGWTIDNIDPSDTTFCPPGTDPDRSFVGKIAVMLSEGTEATEQPGGNPVKVGSRDGWLATSTESTTLQVALGDNRYLILQQTAQPPLSDTDLIRFAATITVTSAAQPGQG